MKSHKQIKQKISNFNLENDKQAAKWGDKIVSLQTNQEDKGQQ